MKTLVILLAIYGLFMASSKVLDLCDFVPQEIQIATSLGVVD